MEKLRYWIAGTLAALMVGWGFFLCRGCISGSRGCTGGAGRESPAPSAAYAGSVGERDQGRESKGNLPESTDVRFYDSLPGCKVHVVRNVQTAADGGWTLRFEASVGLPGDSLPRYALGCIDRMMNEDLTDYFSSALEDSDSPLKIPFFRGDGRDADALMDHYRSAFRKCFDSLFVKESGVYGFGGEYSYEFSACPVWQSGDSTLMTWKFQRYGQLGGSQEGAAEFFVTFYATSGRMLGIRDFYGARQFDAAMAELGRQIKERKLADGEEDFGSMDPDVDDGPEYLAGRYVNGVTKDVFGGKIYPRPALTNAGIVFSYQPYEKEPGYRGPIHFIQPYVRR